MRWSGLMLAFVVLGVAAPAAAADDVCALGSRLMSVTPADGDTLDGLEAELVAEARALFAAQDSLDAGRPPSSPRPVLMCVGNDPARCLPAAPPPVSARLELGRVPRADTSAGLDIPPAPVVALAATCGAVSPGPEGVRARQYRPPRAASRV